ncbi:coiled-coil domain-containing protein [Psychromonas ingrahamii]|uniref:hypothetical protein n=1 Tax=Psychromonas ingrahamii TaxID=357794 RepID=UPI0005A17341|nr:hypothetical protein [Psychromonas ingrahamii]
MANEDKRELDKQTVIWSVCNQMLMEDIPTSRITGRKVASHDDVKWSHTTVTPLVNAWHEQRVDKDREAIRQTQMSHVFVKALNQEVEGRVTKRRQIDDEQMKMLQIELDDMLEINSKLESELATTKQRLEEKSEEATTANTAAYQATKDKELSEKKSTEAMENLQGQLDVAISDSKDDLEQQQTRFDNTISQLKDEHKEAITKLSEKRDDLTDQLTGKTAECAEANVKAKKYEELTENLETERKNNRTLTNNNMRMTAELESKSQSLIDATASIEDGRKQRDKAQQQLEQVTQKITEKDEQFQKLLILSVKAGVNLEITQ